MRVPQEVYPYLRGEVFSGGLRMVICDPQEPALDRIALLEELAADRRVIHLGFADHLPLIEEKRSRGLWLHERLCRVARRCLGVDVNGEAVRFVRDDLGFADVVCADLQRDEVVEIAEGEWDLLIAGEMIEHVDDPVGFLAGVKRACKGRVGSLVLSAPNAFGWVNTRMTMRREEFINSDHRFWFTPYTLAKTASRAGLKPVSFQFCYPTVPSRPGLRAYLQVGPALDYHLPMQFAGLREVLVMECEF